MGWYLNALFIKGQSALANPWGRLILDAVQHVGREPNLEALEAVWDAWEQKQFMGARTVLNVATQTVRHMLYSLGTMTNDHSRAGARSSLQPQATLSPGR